jgi:hypothetical protein
MKFTILATIIAICPLVILAHPGGPGKPNSQRGQSQRQAQRQVQKQPQVQPLPLVAGATQPGQPQGQRLPQFAGTNQLGTGGPISDAVDLTTNTGSLNYVA